MRLRTKLLLIIAAFILAALDPLPMQAAERPSTQTVAGLVSARARTSAGETDPTPPPGGSPARAQLSPGVVIGLALAFASTWVALGIAIGIRRRIDRLVPPPDEAEN